MKNPPLSHTPLSQYHLRAPTTPQKPQPPPLPLQRRLRRRRRLQPLQILRPRRPHRRRQIPLNAPKARIPLIVNRIYTPEEDAAQNIEFLVSAGLDPAVGGAVVEVLERKVARFDLEERVADGEGYFGERRGVGGGGEDPALLA